MGKKKIALLYICRSAFEKLFPPQAGPARVQSRNRQSTPGCLPGLDNHIKTSRRSEASDVDPIHLSYRG